MLKNDPNTELTEKQIYAEWFCVNEAEWRLEDDQVKSAVRLLEKAENDAEIISVRAEDGIYAMAFTFKGVLDVLGKDIEEIAMDSTCKFSSVQFLF